MPHGQLERRDRDPRILVACDPPVIVRTQIPHAVISGPTRPSVPARIPTHTPRINPLRQTSLPLSSAIQTPTSTPIPSTSISSSVETISPLCNFSNARSYALTSPTRMAEMNLPYNRSILGYCAKRRGEGNSPRRSRAGMRCLRISLGSVAPTPEQDETSASVSTLSARPVPCSLLVPPRTRMTPLERPSQMFIGYLVFPCSECQQAEVIPPGDAVAHPVLF